MPIKGFSDTVRIPRLGKIRLGFRDSKNGREYPKAVDYFICPPEVHEVYGEKPRALDIMFPTERAEDFFPTWLKRYGTQAGLICKGDGEMATELAPLARPEVYKDMEGHQWIERDCPYEECIFYQQKHCREVGALKILLPKVRGTLGVYEIDTTSFNSVANVNNAINLLRGMVGRISMIPLTLEVKMEEKNPTVAGGKKIKSVVPILYVKFPLTLGEVIEKAQKRQLVQTVQTLQIESSPAEDDEMPVELYPVLMNAPEDDQSEPVLVKPPPEKADAAAEQPDAFENHIRICMEALGWPPGKRAATLSKPNLDKPALLAELQEAVEQSGARTLDEASQEAQPAKATGGPATPRQRQPAQRPAAPPPPTRQSGRGGQKTLF